MGQTGFHNNSICHNFTTKSFRKALKPGNFSTDVLVPDWYHTHT
jgi:hypothetical protein